MDISNNIHNLNEVMYDYNRNIRYHTDNIHEYNQNIRAYLSIINNTLPGQYISERPIIQNNNPILQNTIPINNIFRNLNQPRNFEDVVVRPTEAQITRALETFVYIPSGESQTCPITLDPIQEGDEVCRIRHCGHIFKRTSIENWFLRNVRCPVCRYDIRDYVRDPSGNTTRFDNLMNDFAEEGRAFINRTPISNLFSANTMTNAIRNFINNELQYIPVNDTTTELLYSFDIPLSVDTSGNYQI